MATQYPSEITTLQALITNNLPTNGQSLITAEVLRGVLHQMTVGIYNSLVQPDDVVLAQFPAYDAETTYEGESEVVVKHEGSLWVFISEEDATGVTPGTNPLVWTAFSLLALAHGRNKDSYLDFEGTHQVSAQQIKEHIANEALHQPQFTEVEFDVNITAAQMAAGHVTPMSIFAAPGAGKVVVGLELYMTIGTEVGTEQYDQSVMFRWTNEIQFPSLFVVFNPSGEGVFQITNVPDGMATFIPYYENQGMEMLCGAEQTQGDHDVRVFGRYWIKTLVNE